MSEKLKFKVFDSSVYLLGKIVTFILIFAPLLLRDTISLTACFGFCGIFALAWLYYLLSTSATVSVEADGISCRRALKKPVQLKWSDIVCTGSFNKTVYGKEIRFRYFSVKQLQPGVLSSEAALPKLSESLIFAVETSELDTAVKKYFSKNSGSNCASSSANCGTDNSAKLKKLITADFVLIFAVCVVYLLRNSALHTMWLPVLIVLCAASAVISFAIIYLKSNNE